VGSTRRQQQSNKEASFLERCLVCLEEEQTTQTREEVPPEWSSGGKSCTGVRGNDRRKRVWQRGRTRGVATQVGDDG
jgi:hypothetical protein